MSKKLNRSSVPFFLDRSLNSSNDQSAEDGIVVEDTSDDFSELNFESTENQSLSKELEEKWRVLREIRC